MNQLTHIKYTNYNWYTQIVEFLTVHPEFKQLLPIVAVDEFPLGFNKNPHEATQQYFRNNYIRNMSR